MRALDLFCGAGGASMGLRRAGYEVTGVDLLPQRHYPFAFVVADALTVDLGGFDLIWASPPCQAYSVTRHFVRAQGRRREHPRLIEAVRERLRSAGVPYIIENVPGAPLIDPVMLCGRSFGLPLIRHRLFESNVPLRVPVHWRHAGFHRPTILKTVAGHSPNRDTPDSWRKAMGIDWMNRDELTQAIPPAYSEYLAQQTIAPRASTEAL